MNRFLKVIISLLYFIFYLLPKKFFATTLGKPSGYLVTLCYHGVLDGERENFAWQMQMIHRDCTAVSLGNPLPLRNKHNLVALTFDDGFANLVKNALPYLELYGIPACIFMVAGKLGSPAIWEGDAHWPYRNESIMTEGELLKLPQALITIGSHSVSHKNLLKYKEDEILIELTESKKILEELLQHPVFLFSFPHGLYNEQVAGLVRQAGYRHAFTLESNSAPNDSLPFLIGRFTVNLKEWKIEFWLKIRGAYGWQ